MKLRVHSTRIHIRVYYRNERESGAREREREIERSVGPFAIPGIGGFIRPEQRALLLCIYMYMNIQKSKLKRGECKGSACNDARSTDRCGSAALAFARCTYIGSTVYNVLAIQYLYRVLYSP